MLTVRFDALTREPGTAFPVLARLCGSAPFAPPFPPPANPSVRARNTVLAAAAKLAAVLLRRVGLHRTLQRLKDDPRIARLVFRPATGADGIRLDAATEALLERRYEACLATVEASSERLAPGIWLRRAGRPAPPQADHRPWPPARAGISGSCQGATSSERAWKYSAFAR